MQGFPKMNSVFLIISGIRLKRYFIENNVDLAYGKNGP